MPYIKKGDLFESQGAMWVALCDDYTKTIRDVDDPQSLTAVGAVRGARAEGGGGALEFVYSRAPVRLVTKAEDR